MSWSSFLYRDAGASLVRELQKAVRWVLQTARGWLVSMPTSVEISATHYINIFECFNQILTIYYELLLQGKHFFFLIIINSEPFALDIVISGVAGTICMKKLISKGLTGSV